MSEINAVTLQLTREHRDDFLDYAENAFYTSNFHAGLATSLCLSGNLVLRPMGNFVVLAFVTRPLYIEPSTYPLVLDVIDCGLTHAMLFTIDTPSVRRRVPGR